MNIDPNTPAFPLTIILNGQTQQNVAGTTGLTIRAEISSRIMAGFCADPETNGPAEQVALTAVTWADALIAQLNEP